MSRWNESNTGTDTSEPALTSLAQVLFWVGASFLAHGGLLVGLSLWQQLAPRASIPVPVKITMRTVPKAVPAISATPVPSARPTPPLEKRNFVNERRREQVKPTVAAQATPVQGLSRSAVSDTAPGPVAPVGNTLLKEDDGTRVAPDAVAPLPQQGDGANLEAASRTLDSRAATGGAEDASLILSSIIRPEYTKPALAARLQGRFPVDVFVDARGNAVEVELVKPVGHGMDERITAALKAARFRPKRNAQGEPQESWITLQFELKIP